MILGNKSHHKHILKINSIKVEASHDILLPGITIDKILTFKQHNEKLCWKAQYKLHALRRIIKYITMEKANILGNAFIGNQFKYALLLCMFCGKILYSRIEKISITKPQNLYMSQMILMRTYFY